MGVMLIEKTAERWDTRGLSYDELTIIVNNLASLVPRKVFAEFFNIDKSWNSEKLLNQKFMDIITMICTQESLQDVDWTVFNDNLEPPNNSEKCKLNTIPESFRKRNQATSYQRSNFQVAQINTDRPT